MPLAQVFWKHKETGETGHGDPASRELVDLYLKESAEDLAPLYEFEVREVPENSQGVA